MFLFLVLYSLLLAPPSPPCKANPALTGKCFVLRGRLRASNGNPTFRIWPVGTARLLGVTGVHPGEEPILPAGLACGFDCDVYADFEVCPFTRAKPGVMQRVCVESAANRTVS
ncbi:MAG TPA: hypothetical protein VGH38_07960, partial [Bryobacteraceae bacterium]